MPTSPFWIYEPWFQPAVVVLTLALFAAIVHLIDIPIECLRRKIRDGDTPSPDGAVAGPASN